MKNIPPVWYWYVARPNEIFVDLDSNAAISRALSVVRRALNAKRVGGPLNYLPIESVWLYRSQAKGHAHLIIVLKSPMEMQTRQMWALWMGGDPLRVAYVLERYRRCGKGDLLASRVQYGFREFDEYCECKEKHKPKHVTEKCSALFRILRVHHSDDYFPRNRDKKKRKPVRFAWGRIPLTNLKRWRVSAERRG